jgi:hypothetical protein
MQGSNGKSETPYQNSTDSFAAVGALVDDVAERGQDLVETGLRAWESQAGRYFEEIAAHSRATLQALAKCRSPLDVLAVEQAWLKTRGEVYLDSGLRFAEAFACVARGLPATDDSAACAPGKTAIGDRELIGVNSPVDEAGYPTSAS